VGKNSYSFPCLQGRGQDLLGFASKVAEQVVLDLVKRVFIIDLFHAAFSKQVNEVAGFDQRVENM
jgi:hypothetical protein